MIHLESEHFYDYGVQRVPRDNMPGIVAVHGEWNYGNALMVIEGDKLVAEVRLLAQYYRPDEGISAGWFIDGKEVTEAEYKREYERILDEKDWENSDVIDRYGINEDTIQNIIFGWCP